MDRAQDAHRPEHTCSPLADGEESPLGVERPAQAGRGGAQGERLAVDEIPRLAAGEADGGPGAERLLERQEPGRE